MIPELIWYHITFITSTNQHKGNNYFYLLYDLQKVLIVPLRDIICWGMSIKDFKHLLRSSIRVDVD